MSNPRIKFDPSAKPEDLGKIYEARAALATLCRKLSGIEPYIDDDWCGHLYDYALNELASASGYLDTLLQRERLRRMQDCSICNGPEYCEACGGTGKETP